MRCSCSSCIDFNFDFYFDFNFDFYFECGIAFVCQTKLLNRTEDEKEKQFLKATAKTNNLRVLLFVFVFVFDVVFAC